MAYRSAVNGGAQDPDALVIGSGPNGLVAACHLARAGWRVHVVETADTAGGAVRSAEITEPGFIHDLGAAFFPFGKLSPALKPLDLEGAGLRWLHAPLESAHIAKDGSCASIARDVELAARCMGGGDDGETWRKMARWHGETVHELLALLLSTLPPSPSAAIKLGWPGLAMLADAALSSGRDWSERHFRSPAAQRVIPGLALHTDIGPNDPCGGAVGFMLAMLASSGGFAVPEGGTSAITSALLARLADHGGTVETGARVTNIVTRQGRAVALRTADGRELTATRAIIADVSAPSLYLDLLAEVDVPSRIRRHMRTFRQGFGTFKMDWALDALPAWIAEDAQRASVVHTGDDNDDLDRFVRQVRAGELPSDPYLVIGQQSLSDPTRAPTGKHTLWAYSRVPSNIEGGWKQAKQRYADRIEERIASMAPGFRSQIRARHMTSPPDLEKMNANLRGGDLGGGSAQMRHQLVFRPVFPYFRYRTPVQGLYLGSSYTHPGAGVHGACGHNAAMMALRDLA